MKITPWICTLLLGCASASAIASYSNKNDKYYIAADLGIFQANFNNQYLDQTDTIPQNIAQTSTQNGYTGGIIFGYRRIMSPEYFLGGEFSANIDGNNASFQSGASSTAFSDQININNHIDLTFKPGLILFNSVAAFLKLGVSYAEIEDSLSSPAGFSSSITNTNSNKNAFGFSAGLGIEKPLTENIFLFVEADYRDYGTIDFSNFANFSATYTHSTHVYAYDTVIGAAYLF